MLYKEVLKIWGKEFWLVNTTRYCTKILTINKKYHCSLHYHKLKDELFFIHKGKIRLDYSPTPFSLSGNKLKSLILKKGDWVRIKPHILHRFTGLRKSMLLESSTHHDDSDSYRLEQSGRIK